MREHADKIRESVERQMRELEVCRFGPPRVKRQRNRWQNEWKKFYTATLLKGFDEKPTFHDLEKFLRAVPKIALRTDSTLAEVGRKTLRKAFGYALQWIYEKHSSFPPSINGR